MRDMKRSGNPNWKAVSAAAVEAAKAFAAQGRRSLREVAAHLAAEGFLSASGAPFGAQSVKRMLMDSAARRVLGRDSNRKYLGIPIPSHPEPALCECCNLPPTGKFTALVPDHCHATGAPRGWLCAKCNAALGMLGDDLAGVERMRAYLMKYSAFNWIWQEGPALPEAGR